MTLRDDLTGMAPRLRRYARALTTGQAGAVGAADDLVQATMMRALGARTLGSPAELTVRLYATVTQLHRDAAIGVPAMAAGAGRPSLVPQDPRFPRGARQTKLSAALMSLPIEEREALLLVALEGFDHSETARILRVSRAIVLSRLTSARMTLDRLLQAPPSPPPRRRSVPHLRLVT